MGEPRIVSVRTGAVRELARPDWDRHAIRTWKTAYVKEEREGPVRAGALGLEGDEQYDRRVHGGTDMAVLAYAGEHYPLWRSETGLEAMGAGGFGENLTLEGLDESSVCIGDRYEAGTTLLEVSQPRGPCANISRRWGTRGLLERATATGRTGWYSRVLREGVLARGDAVRRVARPCPEWTVARVFRLRMDPALDPAGARSLARCEVLSSVWRERFATQAARLGA